ncbi:MAG: thiamine phosphate synthase [Acidobacteriota bacterium]
MISYAIADAAVQAPPQLLARVQQLNDLGADFIQLRAKELDTPAFLALAEGCRKRVDGNGTKFVVNSRADIAMAVDADGVHLPADGMPAYAVRALRPGLQIGRSCHSAGDVKRAAGEGCDYVLIGPLFSPRSKIGGPPLEENEIRACARVPIPLFALGGMERSRLRSLAALPIDGIAAVTLFMADEPIAEIMEEVRAL